MKTIHHCHHFAQHYRRFFQTDFEHYISRKFYLLKNDGHVIDQCFNGRSYQTKDLHSWSKVPLSYMSASDALWMALSLPSLDSEQKFCEESFKKACEYAHWSLEYSYLYDLDRAKRIDVIAHLLLTAQYTRYSLHQGDLKKQKKYIILANFHLDQAYEVLQGPEFDSTTASILSEMIFIYKTIIHVCLNQLEIAISYICKAAKISPFPAPLWKVLSDIYKNLGQQKISQFYFRRFKSSSPEQEMRI